MAFKLPHHTLSHLWRTFGTPTDKAGVPKKICDRLQNHALQEVSSKHDDHWNCMVEKRAGMAKRDRLVHAMLAMKRMKIAT